MNKDIVEEIKRIMRREKANQEDLRRLGVSCDVSRLLRRVASPTWRNIQKIANALGYTAYVVFRKKK